METKKTTVKKKGIAKFDYKKIKTFEDACLKENIDPEKLPDVSMLPEEFRKALIGCYKLFIIFKAINNGWIADYNNYNQLKYFPFFSVLSSGFGFVSSDYICGITFTSVGVRLCTDTNEKALYIAETFQEEYGNFFLKQE